MWYLEHIHPPVDAYINNDIKITLYVCKDLNALYSNNNLGYFVSLSSSFLNSTCCTKMKRKVRNKNEKH